MENNAFGKLIRTYREQRGWKQEELAERWGFTREYVSQIERGKRRLDRQEHVLRLAGILGIPEERLEAVGKSVPPRQKNTQSQSETDDILLQALLEPAQTTVKMSYLVWQGDSSIVDIGENLRNWESHLNKALKLYRGQFRNSALRLLADVHEMRGKLAIERAATKEAMAHFQEMYDIAEELNDSELVILALIHQSEMLRRRSWYEASFRRMEVAEKNIQKHVGEVSKYIQGVLWKAYAISYFNYGDEQGFLRSIERAEAVADSTATTIDALNNGFDKFHSLDVLVNNAARVVDKPMLTMTEEDWDRVVDTNMKGTFFCSQIAASYMLQQDEGGIILNIGAPTGIRGRKNGINTCASKAGIMVMTLCLALELGPKIRVNTIIPGLTWTEETIERMHLDDPAVLQARTESIPLQRIGTPEDVANTVTMLLSDAARFINGQKIVVDGGQYLTI